MTSFIDVGDKEASAPPMVHVGVDMGQSESVKIKNAAGDVLSYFTDTHSLAAGTITVGNSVTFTGMVWLKSAGRTSVQLSGGKHGG